MTECIKRTRDLFEYALYKFTIYLLTYNAVGAYASDTVRLYWASGLAV